MKCYEFIKSFLTENGYQPIPIGFNGDVNYGDPYIAIEKDGLHFSNMNILDNNDSIALDGSEITLNVPGMTINYAIFDLANPDSLPSLLKQLEVAHGAYIRSQARKRSSGGSTTLIGGSSTSSGAGGNLIITGGTSGSTSAPPKPLVIAPPPVSPDVDALTEAVSQFEDDIDEIDKWIAHFGIVGMDKAAKLVQAVNDTEVEFSQYDQISEENIQLRLGDLPGLMSTDLLALDNS